MATLDEARACPKCGSTGEASVERKNAGSSGPNRGSTLYVFNCQNEKCEWYKTGWVVQVKPDGRVVERSQGTKDYPELPNMKPAAERYLEQLKIEFEQGETHG